MKSMRIFLLSLLLCSILQTHVAGQTTEDNRFQTVGEHIVYDSKTGLMWASSDNGKDIDWYEAESYCRDFKAGGYDDWRLPDIEELTSLYTSGRKNKDGYYIIDLVTISDCCMWSADTNMGGSSIFSYKTGKEPVGFLADKYQLRALPVRNHKMPEADGDDIVKVSRGVE